MKIKLSAAAAAAILTLAGAAAAQTQGADTGAYSDTGVTPVEQEDDGMDLGWLGLLGLIGLLGLKKKQDDVRTHPAPTTHINR